ncbi:hypothetical protein MAR_006060, partial [Mya arenaria]
KKSTVNKTIYDLKILASYLHIVIETLEISESPPFGLCNILCKFFGGVKKPDGSNYKPTTHGPEFVKLNEVFQARQNNSKVKAWEINIRGQTLLLKNKLKPDKGRIPGMYGQSSPRCGHVAQSQKKCPVAIYNEYAS